MHDDRPTFFVLNARLGWRGSALPDAGAIWARDDGMFGLRLPIAEGDGDAPLALTAADGSLGGLLMPRGMALDAELRLSLVIASAGAWRIRRYDPSRGSFEAIPDFAASIAPDATPLSLAALGMRLYLADPNGMRLPPAGEFRCTATTRQPTTRRSWSSCAAAAGPGAASRSTAPGAAICSIPVTGPAPASPSSICLTVAGRAGGRSISTLPRRGRRTPIR